MAWTAQRQLAGQQHQSLCADWMTILSQTVLLALPVLIGYLTGQSLLLVPCLLVFSCCRVERPWSVSW